MLNKQEQANIPKAKTTGNVCLGIFIYELNLKCTSLNDFDLHWRLQGQEKSNTFLLLKGEKFKEDFRRMANCGLFNIILLFTFFLQIGCLFL